MSATRKPQRTLQEHRDRCARASRARREATAGTLGHFDMGLFVEGTAPFPRLALASLFPPLHAFNLETWRLYQRTGNGLHPRILPIRRDKERRQDTLAALFSLPNAGGLPLQVRYELTDYAELMDFDLVAMRDRPQDFAGHRDDTFRLLVCTHGKVDPCCAVDGNRLYRHLRTRDDVEAWQAAHFGGCRFAANVWCLPSGNCYGHVSTETVDALIDAERAGRVFHRGFRGRIGQSMQAAAAEFLVRQRYDAWGFDDLSIDADMEDLVTVRTPAGVRRHRLASDPHPDVFFTTCRAEEPRAPPVYRLADIA